MLGVFLGVFSSMFYGYEDLFGLYEKVFLLDIVLIVMNGIVVEKDNFKIKGINCQCIFNIFFLGSWYLRDNL